MSRILASPEVENVQNTWNDSASNARCDKWTLPLCTADRASPVAAHKTPLLRPTTSRESSNVVNFGFYSVYKWSGRVDRAPKADLKVTTSALADADEVMEVKRSEKGSKPDVEFENESDSFPKRFEFAGSSHCLHGESGGAPPASWLVRALQNTPSSSLVRPRVATQKLLKFLLPVKVVPKPCPPYKVTFKPKFRFALSDHVSLPNLTNLQGSILARKYDPSSLQPWYDVDFFDETTENYRFSATVREDELEPYAG